MKMETGGDGKVSDIVLFTLQVIRGRWFMMFASFLIMAGAGASYVFGIYSQVVKQSLSYNQTTLNLLGFFKDLGALIGILSGLITEVAPPSFVLLLGAAMNFGGYLMIWLAVSSKIPKPKVWQMCLYFSIGSNSQNFSNTVVLVTCIKTFPRSRGIIIGLLKGFTGLSGALIIQIYLAVYGNDPKSLILLIGWLPAAISVFFVYTIRPLILQEQNRTRVFYQYLYISLAIAFFVMVISIVQKHVFFSHSGYIICATVVCFLLCLPMAIAIKQEVMLWNIKKQQTIHPSTMSVAVEEPKPLELSSLSSTCKEDESKAPLFQRIFKIHDKVEDHGILQALLSVNMIIIFVITFCGFGSNLTAIDNLGQIGKSLGYTDLAISTFVSLVSTWNFCGRVFSGFVSEILVTKIGFPRPLMLTIALSLSFISQMLVAFPFPGSLYIASVLIGFSYGAQLTLLYTIISELFGLKHYATLFNIDLLASPLGSYVLNVKVAGVLYDKEALKQLTLMGRTSSGSVTDLNCIGKQCYGTSFLILAGMSCLGGVASLVLVVRTKKFYKGDLYEKFKLEDKAIDGMVIET